MSFPVFAWSVRFFSLVALIVFTTVALMMDPDETPWAIAIFFIAWFLLWIGMSAWGLLVIYRHFIGEAGTLRYKRYIFRQSVLMSIATTSVLFLKYIQALEWWTGGFVFAGVLLLEFTLRR